ncbi:MAG: hypothetical protein GF355_04390 [Candidatus Eisenbacteria bacterium]|nr:hypothetical protein [Candidatus Eisenbacteria bacterium]
MDKKTEIDALEVVRRIRDKQAERLHGKSDKDIIEFFRKARQAKRKHDRPRRRNPANRVDGSV